MVQPGDAGIRAQAVAGIAKVGTTETTVKCEGEAQPEASPGDSTPVESPAATSGGGAALSPGGRSSRSGGGAGGGRTASPNTPSTATSSGQPETVETSPAGDVDVPPFGGRSATAFGGTVVALLGLMALNSLSVFRLVPARLARWRSRDAAPGTGSYLRTAKRE